MRISCIIKIRGALSCGAMGSQLRAAEDLFSVPAGSCNARLK